MNGTVMTSERLLETAEVLGWMSDSFGRLVDESKEATTNGLRCVIAQLLCVELARHLADGKDVYDALVSTALGELPLTERQQFLLRLLGPGNEK